MDTDKYDTMAMPLLSSREKQKKDLWDAETTHLEAVHTTPQRNSSLEHAARWQDTQQLPTLRYANMAKRATSYSHKAITNNFVSPELARLIQHREQVANQETKLLQAVTLSSEQEQGKASASTKMLQAKPKQASRRLFSKNLMFPSYNSSVCLNVEQHASPCY